MWSKAFLPIFCATLSACSAAVQFIEKMDPTEDADNDDTSFESESEESFVSAPLVKYQWVPQTPRSQKLYTISSANTYPDVSTKKLQELKRNLTKHFERPVHDFKFAVSIQKKGAHYATGALIDKKWVITTAKEFYNVRESIKLFRLRIGTTDCKHGGILIPIKEILIHPSYKFGDITNDVALLRLAVSAEDNDDIETIQLAQFKACNKFVSVYWPRVFANNVLLPATSPERVKHNHIRVSTQIIYPWKECFKWLARKNITLQESSLCLKPIAVRHSNCMPDAGAPILSSDGLWGVTSGWKSDNCIKDPSPTIVTRTSAAVVNSWLKKWTSSPIWSPGAMDPML